jgi:ribosome biogenesis protein SSF1/2
MFPPISPEYTTVESIKRVLLFHKVKSESDTEEYIDMRHYLITTRQTGLSKAVRYLTGMGGSARAKNTQRVAGAPDMSKMEDVSEFLLNASGYASDSEAESDIMSDFESQTSESSGRATRQKAVKLIEVGPRMRLQFYKAEDGHNKGNVVFHLYVNRTKVSLIKPLCSF